MSIPTPQLPYKHRMSVYEYFGTATSSPANDRWSADKIAGLDVTTATYHKDSRSSNSASDVHISVHSCGSKLSAKTDYIPLKMNFVNKIDEEQRGDCQNESHLEASQDLSSDPATAASQPKYPVCGCGSPMINTNRSNSKTSDRSLPRINSTILDEISQWFAEWSQGDGFDPEVDYDLPCSAVEKPADVEELHGDVDEDCCAVEDQVRQVAPTGEFLEGKRSEFFDDLWKTLSTGSTASSEPSSSSRSRAVPGIITTEPSTCDTLQAARQTSADQEDDTVLFHSVRLPRPVTDFRNLEPDMFGHRHGSISPARSASPPPLPPQQLRPENKRSSIEQLPSSRKSKLATFFNPRKSHPPLVDGSETSSGSNQALRVLRDRLQQARARVRSLIDVKAGEFAGAIARDASRGRGGKVTVGK